MDSFVKQTNHRIELENKVVESDISIAKRGQVFAFVIAAVTIGFGFVLILKDKNGAGIAAIVTALAALLGVFIYGKNSQRKERIEKSRLNP